MTSQREKVRMEISGLKHVVPFNWFAKNKKWSYKSVAKKNPELYIACCRQIRNWPIDINTYIKCRESTTIEVDLIDRSFGWRKALAQMPQALTSEQLWFACKRDPLQALWCAHKYLTHEQRVYCAIKERQMAQRLWPEGSLGKEIDALLDKYEAENDNH